MKMKRIGALLPIIALVVACRSEQEDPAATPQPIVPRTETETVFYGTMESGPETRVYADESLHVLWNADDRVSIFAKKDFNREYRFTGANGDNAGEFASVSQEAGTGNPLSYNYAVYPYSSVTSISAEGILSVVLPAEQTYRADTFGLGANTMVAVSEDNQLSFKNAGTFVSIGLYGDNVAVSRITFKGNKQEKLAGQASIQVEPDGAPVLAMASENVSETVTLVCAEPVPVGADEEHATAFWFVLPPTKFAEGFTVTVEDSQGRTYEKSTSKEIEFNRNKLKRMKAFECTDPEFGLYPVSGEQFVYDSATDQMNIYEAEGNAWFRFLRIPALKMYELGPIPLNVIVGDSFTATLAVSTAGVPGSSQAYELTARSFQSGKLILGSQAGDQFIIRF